jgi:hypothetical protein
MLTRLNLTVAWFLAGDLTEARAQLAASRSAPDPDKSGHMWKITADSTAPPLLEYQPSLERYALRLADVLNGAN